MTDPIEAERQRLRNKPAPHVDDIDPIERVRRELRDRNARLVARQHEQHVKEER